MKILIAEDDLTSRRILQAMLTKWGYEVVACSDGDEAWAQLTKSDSPRLAILDWTMPGLDGVELCHRIRASATGRDQYKYVIILTARGGRESIIAGLEAGADDYIIKPFDSDELRVRIRAGTRIVELHSELALAEAAMRKQALQDPLTGTLNRRAILELLEKELATARSENKPLAIIIADLDHFKAVNDTYGHQAGDEALCEFVRRAASVIGEHGRLGRYGGEEFLIVMPGRRGTMDEDLYERLRAAMSEMKVNTVAGPVSVTVSLGVAGFDPQRNFQDQSQDGSLSHILINLADGALYRAKQRGRNRVEYQTSSGSDEFR